MSLKEIEKLRERVEKDPNSKLFVPLAEEYRKEGMLDDAVDVLLKGIERQPAYMSARVSLGKIYLEKGMPNEARNEFEAVVRSIPDNLYAHKKLAELYRNTGEKEPAIRSYRTVLKLNAMDEDALAALRELEGGEEEPPFSSAAEATGPAEFAEAVTALEEAEAAEALPEEEVVQEAESPAAGAEGIEPPETEAPSADREDIMAFKDSLFGAETTPEETWQGITVAGEETLEVRAEEEPGEVSFEEMNEALRSEEATPAGPAAEEFPVADGIAEEVAVAAAPAEAPARKGPTLDDADRFVSEGNYAAAMNIYSSMLSANPGDKRILQRVGELKALLKLLGKDQEVLIARLNAFLAGIDKRRDEFLRSS